MEQDIAELGASEPAVQHRQVGKRTGQVGPEADAGTSDEDDRPLRRRVGGVVAVEGGDLLVEAAGVDGKCDHQRSTHSEREEDDQERADHGSSETEAACPGKPEQAAQLAQLGLRVPLGLQALQVQRGHKVTSVQPDPQALRGLPGLLAQLVL